MHSLVLGLLFVVQIGELQILPPWWYGQPSAAIWKDQLFVAISDGRQGPGTFYRGQLDATRSRVRDPLAYDNPTGESTRAKLEIRDNQILLFAAGRAPRLIPFADLHLLELSDFGLELVWQRGGRNAGFLTDGPLCGDSVLLLFPSHRKPDVPEPPLPVLPMTARSSQLVIEYRQREYTLNARFDVQYLDPKTVRLFHAYKDTLFVSVEPNYIASWYRDLKTWEVAKNIPKPPPRQLRTGKLPKEFTERFAAYTTNKRDYIVTDNGKIYLASPKGKTEVEVTKVWDDPKRRIVGVVQDQANDVVYGWGFATTSTKPERFYVKFEPKPVAVEYKRMVPLWGDRSDAYLESYECARAFRNAAGKK